MRSPEILLGSRADHDYFHVAALVTIALFSGKSRFERFASTLKNFLPQQAPS